MASIILEARKVDPLRGEEIGFLRLMFDEDRVVGHFVEGVLHPSFGFRVREEDFSGIYGMAVSLPKCEHKSLTDHLLTFCNVVVTGSEHERTYHCLSCVREEKPEYRRLRQWVDEMLAIGRNNMHPVRLPLDLGAMS